MSRNSETGGGGWVHPKAASGLGCRRALVSPGWPISVLVCMTGLRKPPSGLVWLPFLTMSLFSQSARAVKDGCKSS